MESVLAQSLTNTAVSGVVLALAVACGGADDADDDGYESRSPSGVLQPTDYTTAVFDPDKVLDIQITIDEADWDALRRQDRTIVSIFDSSCNNENFYSPFTYFPADVTVDGNTVEQVGLRKKGFLGSLDPNKPSLKINFDEYVAGQQYSGMKRMTFNNARQDPGYVNQCIGYQLFRDAGVVAPRCNFATITVNGVNKGLYVHVESIKKPFVARHFADADGNMYEGTVSDFQPPFLGTFQKKTNTESPDRSDIEAITQMLETVADDELAAELDTLWASEVLIGHWDGYAGNQNNYYIYRDPETDLFTFIAWGIDALLFDNNPNGSPSGTTGVFATSLIPRRLYLNDDTRDAYVARVKTMLDTVWDEQAIIAEIDRMEDLIRPYLLAGQETAFDQRIVEARDFVSDRRSGMLSALEPTPPPWTQPLRGPFCLPDVGDVALDFATTWGSFGTLDPYIAGSGALNIDVYNQVFVPATVGAVAGMGSANTEGKALLGIVGADAGLTFIVYVETDPALVVAGADIAIEWNTTRASLFYIDPAQSPDPQLLGYINDGTIHLDTAGQTTGAPVSGSIDGIVLQPFF